MDAKHSRRGNRKATVTAGEQGVKIETGNRNNKVVLCKVCLVVVPRRKEYHPSICEACQKFFRRNCGRRAQLICSDGDGKCTIDAKNRRFCTACRFQKCIAVGMQSKFLNGDTRDNGFDVTSPTNTKVSPMSSHSTDDAPDRTPTQQVETNSSSEGGSGQPPLVETESSPQSVTIAAQMSTVSLANCNGSGANSNNDSTPCQALVPLVRDPPLFDGTPVEKLLQISAQGYTHLHGLEFLDLKRPRNPIDSLEMLTHLGMKHLQDGFLIGMVYGNHFLKTCDQMLTQNELQMMSAKSMPLVSVAFNNLASNAGSSFFGINDSLAPLVLHFIPACRRAFEACKSLSDAFETWNPSFIEAALLLSILFFEDAPNERLARLRQHLVLAFNLNCSRQCNGDSIEIEERRRSFEHCVRLAHVAVNKTLGLTQAAANYGPLFAMASQLIQGNPMMAIANKPQWK